MRNKYLIERYSIVLTRHYWCNDIISTYQNKWDITFLKDHPLFNETFNQSEKDILDNIIIDYNTRLSPFEHECWLKNHTINNFNRSLMISTPYIQTNICVKIIKLADFEYFMGFPIPDYIEYNPNDVIIVLKPIDIKVD